MKSANVPYIGKSAITIYNETYDICPVCFGSKHVTSYELLEYVSLHIWFNMSGKEYSMTAYCTLRGLVHGTPQYESFISNLLKLRPCPCVSLVAEQRKMAFSVEKNLVQIYNKNKLEYFTTIDVDNLMLSTMYLNQYVAQVSYQKYKNTRYGGFPSQFSISDPHDWNVRFVPSHSTYTDLYSLSVDLGKKYNMPFRFNLIETSCLQKLFLTPASPHSIHKGVNEAYILDQIKREYSF